jgi:hypothetical protein
VIHRRTAGVVAIIAAAAWLVALLLTPRRALLSYAVAYVTVLTVVLGALFQVMVSYLTGARWFAVMRRFSLTLLSAMPAVAALGLPLLIGAKWLYPWARTGGAALAGDRGAWLNLPFFVVRDAAAVLACAWFAERIRRTAWRQDTLSAEAIAENVRMLRRLSAIGVVVVALCLTLLTWDWVMGLDPAWYSSVFAAYLFAGGYLSALGAIALLTYLVTRRDSTAAALLHADQIVSLGSVTLTFALFWAYMAFSQYLIIWIGNVPADAGWYVARGSGGWRLVSWAVLAGQLIIPFVVLLSHRRKQRIAVAAGLGVVLLVAHGLDIWWLMVPGQAGGVVGYGVDGIAVVLVAASAVAAGAQASGRMGRVAIGDPDLAE